MSDDVRDLIIRGTAAAKAKDKEQARFFLEWAARHEEADRDQRATAWLWLSEISDDPAEKRRCLENVLAHDMRNPLARRGLAILEGRLKPEDVIQPDQRIRRLKPQETRSPDVRRYVCAKCGGRMSLDTRRHMLRCDYCGQQMTEYDALMSDSLEQDFFAAMPTAKAHRWELPAKRSLACQGCGATFILPAGHISGQCPFCKSPHVVEAVANAELIQPEGFVPFQIDDERALQNVRQWLKQQRFRPSDLDTRSATISPRGIYLPFWTFDVGGEVKWHCMVVEGYGRSARLVPRSDTYVIMYNDVLVPATHSLPADLLGGLSDFDTSKNLAPYSTELLSDRPAEVYQVPLANASLVARQRALAKAQTRIKQNFSQSVRDVNVASAGLGIDSYKLVLLPVWITGYHYKKRGYPLLVNGQTGSVSGSVPRSRVQNALAWLLGKQ